MWDWINARWPFVGLIRQPLGPPGPAATIIGSASHGSLLFERNCQFCHGPEGTDKVPNPGSDAGTVPPLAPVSRTIFDLDPQTFSDNIDRFLQHGSVPRGSGPELHMLPLGDTNTLTQQAISDIEAYVLHLNGVDRARLAHPGLPPHLFLLLSVLVFGLTGLILAGRWIQLLGRSKK
jgi:mono/diheme cytochrome c family protein